MSAVVISKLDHIVVLVSDRRSVIDLTVQIGHAMVRLVVYQDHVRKIFLFAKQLHAYVAVTSHGYEPTGFEVSDLISEFEETLPNQRLSIKGYAERLSTFLTANYPSDDVSQNNDPSTFNVVGLISEIRPLNITNLSFQDPATCPKLTPRSIWSAI
jgi:hypothetical protein